MESEIEFLARENRDLREKLSQVLSQKETDFHSPTDQLLDQIQGLKKENNHLQAALEGIHLNLQPGDVVFVNSQKLINSDAQVWMKIAQKFKCTFVSLPLEDEAMDVLIKKTPLELERFGLKRIADGDIKHTPIDYMNDIMLKLKSDIERLRAHSTDNPQISKLQQATRSLFQSMEDIKYAYEDSTDTTC